MSLYPKIKRALDLLVSVMLLLVLFPILLLVVIMIKIDSKGPIFFVQERIGLNKYPFRIFKFRTMTHQRRIPTEEIFSGHPEVTRTGAFLRKTKLDETPQLINVIIGDMSIVGPRPALKSHIEFYTEEAYLRHEVRPGLTGLAQINGNIRIPWEQRWIYDSIYVKNLSFINDIKILIRTPFVIINGSS